MVISMFVQPKFSASDRYLLVIVVALFLVGLWLLYGELRNWVKRYAEWEREPSAIGKLLISILGAERQSRHIQPNAQTEKPENQTSIKSQVEAKPQREAVDEVQTLKKAA